MPRSGKYDKHTEQVPHGNGILTKVEPLHQQPKQLVELRLCAERVAKERIAKHGKKTVEDTSRLIHELEVHQVELEMQNEELHETHKELENSRNKYADLYDFSPVGYLSFDKNRLIIEANLTVCRMLGIERASLIKKPFHLFVSKESQDRFYLHCRQVLERGYRHNCEITLVIKGENKLDVMLESVRVANADGDFTLCRTTVIDITERKRAGEEMLWKTAFLESQVEADLDGVLVVDSNNHKILTNKRLIMMWKVPQNIVEDKNDASLFQYVVSQIKYPEQFLEKVKYLYSHKDETSRDEIEFKNGMVFDRYTSPVIDKKGKYFGRIWAFRDITEQKLAEHQLLVYQKHLKRLAAQLTLTEERERRRIAGEIHDEISQTLAMVKVKLETLQKLPPSEAPVAKIQEISSSIAKVIQETRTLIFDLSNPILYELGFEVAVAEWLSERVHVKHGIATEFRDDSKPKPLDGDVKVMLFRNVRELLNNCIKYANAETIRINIRRIDNSIEVIVEDNGGGFDLAEVWTTALKNAKFGLFSIRESLEEIGGRFEIESKPGAGCKALMMAPLKDQSSNKEV